MDQRTEIIYLDIDGTLRDEQKGIPDSAAWAIDQCRSHGIRIVICTGRSPGTIQDDVAALPKDGTISGGGCYIQYHGLELERNYFPAEVVKKVFTWIPCLGLSLAVETEQKVFMDYQTSLFYRSDLQRKTDDYKSGNDHGEKNKILYEDNLGEIKQDLHCIHKICVLGSKSSIDKVSVKLKEESEIIQKREWNDRWYLELLPKGCDKGRAVRFLNRRLGIPKSQSMSFGDSENDIAMMKATGIPIMVGYGSMMVRKYASSICEPVMEDGIYKELIRRNIIRPYERRIINEEAMVAGGSYLSNLSEKFL